ncbi:universal stress protein [Streptomyces europaeiscabiei]|uniref:universal stress protein n=1 Tax=Streptomyces europaeiscabiei TaxID=146819 RepID=UPI0029AAF612|nr:universal stress protein [Streptomyces europaeiscabiei]MDX3696783.1 universal stress protein [Streptomyces europaeiscabiei]
MEPVVLACDDPSSRSRSTVVDWARDEARLRGVSLHVTTGSPADPDRASMIVHMTVCGIPREVASTRRPPRSWPPAAAAPSCPLVLVPDAADGMYRSAKITLGVDARDPAAGAVDFAFDSARTRKALLHAVHAWSLPSHAAEWPFALPEKDRATWEDQEVQLLADVLRPWREKHPEVPVLEDVVLLTPVQALLHHSAGAALVVVGAKPGMWWGETAGALLRAAPCPVAVVPGRSTAR